MSISLGILSTHCVLTKCVGGAPILLVEVGELHVHRRVVGRHVLYELSPFAHAAFLPGFAPGPDQ